MAGTRLAAHTCFVLSSFIAVFVAWRLGLVERAPLPLPRMLTATSTHPLPMPVDIDLVLLRSISGVSSGAGECSSCRAVLDAVQADPVLARRAFLRDEIEVSVSADGVRAKASAEGIAPDATGALDLTGDDQVGGENGTKVSPLFFVRDVRIRVAHATDHDRSMPSPDDPAMLDDWLYESFISQQSMNRGGSNSASSANASAPLYTFFLRCPNSENSAASPSFAMGKRRHGILHLGCSCDCDEDSSELVASHSSSGGATKLVAATVSATLQALAGIIFSHIFRIPISARDRHVRPSQAYRLSFSLLSEDPGKRRCTWQFASASQKYLKPMLLKLSPVASFAVQSQEISYARLAPAPPRLEASSKRWYYSPYDLERFLSANDFSMLDLAAGWGPARVTGGNDSDPSTSLSTPRSQVPINFMVFCPAPKYSPLVFMKDWFGAKPPRNAAAEAFEIPGFGGVSVTNLDDFASFVAGGKVVDLLTTNRLRSVLSAHVSQLRRVIGLPKALDRPTHVPWPYLPTLDPALGIAESEDRQSQVSCSCAKSSRRPKHLRLTFLPSPLDGVTDWEVDALLRSGLARNRAAAAETLRSLAALVESQPEMEVSAKVAEEVNAALLALDETDAAISAVRNARLDQVVGIEARRVVPGYEGEDHHGQGRDDRKHDWVGSEAMRYARESLRKAEGAYFDPTMVPQLYFPEDHLMAVYLPFLGPLAFPLIWGFVQELVRYVKKRRVKKAKARAEAKGGVNKSAIRMASSGSCESTR